ncbi:MAG: hypothetical protein ACRBN8_43915 [Nannocystales bacterium]
MPGRLIAAALGLWLASVATTAIARKPTGAQTPASTPLPLVVEVRGLDKAELRQALALRMRGRDVALWGHASQEPFAYALVDYAEPTLRVTLIQPNGHAYDRTVDNIDEQPLRSAAVELATLVDAVGEGTLTPTRQDVEQPEPETGPEPKPEPEPQTKPSPEPKPKPVSEPDADNTKPGLSIGLSLSPVVGIGLAPADGPAFLGAGSSVGVLLGTGSGALFGAQARVLGRAASGFRIIRARFGFAGGYRWQRGALEFVTLGRVFVEPWWLRRDGDAAPLVHEDEPVSRQPLLGGGVRLSPGVLLDQGWDARVRGRLGALVDLDASVIPDDGGRSLILSAQTESGSTPFARLGGVELALGLDFTLWF